MRANTGGGSKKSVNPNNGTNGRNGPEPENLAGSSATRAEIETRARQAHEAMLAQQAQAAQAAQAAAQAAAHQARLAAQAQAQIPVADPRAEQIARARQAIQSPELHEEEPEEDRGIINDAFDKDDSNRITFSQRIVGRLTEEELDLPKSKRKKILFRRRAIRVIIAMVIALALAVGVKLVVDRWVNPQVDYVADMTVSGAGALESWQLAVNTADVESIKGIVPKSFVAQEGTYTASSKTRTAFVNTVLASLKYDIPIVDRETVYGEKVTSGLGNVTGPSDLMNGEATKLSYIDYSAIPVDAETLKAFVAAEKFDVKQPDVAEKLTELYSKYIISIAKSKDSLPVKTIEWTPDFIVTQKQNAKGKTVDAFVVSGDEDIAVDNLLFASNEFWVSQYQFSRAIVGGEGNKAYEEWLGLTKKEQEAAAAEKLVADEKVAKEAEAKAAKEAEAKATDKATASAEATLSAKDSATPSATASAGEQDTSNNFPPGMAGNETHTTARPGVGNPKFIDPFWVGAHYLQIGRVEFAKSFDVTVKPIIAPVGLGTRDSTAGLNVSVLTTQFDTVEGKEVKTPIRVEMLSILHGQEAINYFQSKDTRNRGFLSDSQVKYIALSYRVTNLGGADLVVRENSTLSDDQMNITGTTGNVFGLATSIKLKPGESGVVESWAASPTLDKSFIIWGKDFSRKADVIWFRQLAGDKGSVNRQEGIDDAPDIAPQSTTAPGTTGGFEDVVPLDEIGKAPADGGAKSTAPSTTKSTAPAGSTTDDGSK